MSETTGPAPNMAPSSASTDYIVVLRGQTFTLTRSQVEFEPNSLFGICFLGDFREGEEKKMVLDRHPATFAVILDHLSGYDVLPLAEKEWVDAGLSEEKMMRYLASDADYYSLDVLARRILVTSAKEQANQYTEPKVEMVSSSAVQPLTQFLLDRLGDRYFGYRSKERDKSWTLVERLSMDSEVERSVVAEALGLAKENEGMRIRKRDTYY